MNRTLKGDHALVVREKSQLGADSSPEDAAVVLVHGVIVSGRYMTPLAEELAPDFPVLVPDLPGYGRSDPPPSPPSLADLADAAVAAARAAGYERAALVGNSFGAQIAIEAALRHPDVVERVALVGLTTDPRARSLPRQFWRWLRCARDEDLSVLPVMARDLYDIGPRQAVHMLRVMMRDRPERKLPRVRQPALVVRGAGDRIAPIAWCREAADLLPDGGFATVPGCAHMPNWTAPRALAQVLREFLADLA
ncbi:MAG TPA: alpha/beta hydrolase [Solirubrobacterales bacterium]|nr:alpha/beta hydrolase [Solirubrobacterales bacterium]